MKKWFLSLLLIILGFTTMLPSVHAEDKISDFYDIKITPQPYPGINCPPEMQTVYAGIGEECAETYEEFLEDPITKHYWIEDPVITAQGKANERARQFLYWVLTTNAVDEAPVLRSIWNISSIIALFGVVLIAAIFGIGYIISRRTNYDFKIRVWPTLIKLGVMLLYIVFSASIVLLLIQLSEVLMKFFIDNLGGRDLFNIYFENNAKFLGATEASYKNFFGARDLNIRVQEGAQAEIFLLKMTNVTYYVMGVMLLLRKILLWFLLFVSPFLALLMPFVLIRNTGWIWIGVFFQWLFYGPLLALFLGATSTIWKAGIPFNFDFSRVTTAGFQQAGYVYPTGINIVYGGPGQNDQFGRIIQVGNNGNYVDTFAEYVITLIMLWAVTFFPWWLLRIFRDYCCEGIYAMRNILMAMYDQMRAPSPKGPGPVTPGKGPTTKIDVSTPIQTNINVSLGSLQAIQKTLSKDLSKSLNLQATRMVDVARLETNKQMKTTVMQNLTYLSNPAKAQVPAERQQYMNIRSELFNRAIKSDSIAQTILASTSTSTTEKTRIREEILKSLPQEVSISQATTERVKLPKEKVFTITNNYTQSIINNEKTVNNIATTTNTSKQDVKNILSSYSQHTAESPTKIIQTIVKETNIKAQTVKQVLAQNGAIGKYVSQLHDSAKKENLSQEQMTKVVQDIRTLSTSDSTTDTHSVLEKITEKIHAPVENIKQFISQTYTTFAEQPQSIENIASMTNVQSSQVRNILTTYASQIDKPQETIIQNIAQTEKLDTKQVSQVMNTANTMINASSLLQTQATQNNISTTDAPQILQIASAPATQTAEQKERLTQPVVKMISYKSNISEDSSKHIVENIMNTAVNNEHIISTVQQATGLQSQQVKNVINTFTKNVSQPTQVIIDKINQSSGIAKDKVHEVLTATADTVLATKDVVNAVAVKEGVKEEDVANTIQTQMDLASKPEEHIEQTITIPQSVSIEDYEQVKDMWTKHYEDGEIPLSDQIKSRADWVEQEIVYITNTLNKILSSDEELRQEGLDELGFLLPIFLINNLKGEELIVYLKAKLEAAKSVHKILSKEEEIKAKYDKDNEEEEVFVDVPKKEEEAQPMHLDLEDETKAPQSIEDRVQAVQEKLTQIEEESQKAEEPRSIDDIKSKLQEKAVPEGEI